MMMLVLRKTETMQHTVERHYSDLAERASDALGNIALVQSFARVDTEVSALRSIGERLLAAQFPVLSWWAAVAVLTRAATTVTMLAHHPVRHLALSSTGWSRSARSSPSWLLPPW